MKKPTKKSITDMMASIDKINGALEGLKGRINGQIERMKAGDDCMGRAISHFMDEGKDQDQAVAIAYSICGEKCLPKWKAKRKAATYAKKCCKSCKDKK